MKTCLAFFLLFFSVKAFSLTAHQIDSMWSVFNNARQPIAERVYALYRLHFEYDDENPDKAIELARLVTAASKKNNYSIGAGVAEIILGNALTYKYSKDSAAIHRDNAIAILLSCNGSDFYLAYAYMYKAESLADRGYRDSATVLYDIALNTCIEKSDYLSATDILLHYAGDCRRGANYQKASTVLSKAISFAEKYKYQQFIAAIYIEMADVFKLTGNNSKYEEYSLLAFNKTLLYNSGLKLARNLSRISTLFQEKKNEAVCLQIGHIYDSLAKVDLNQNIINLRNGYWAKYYLTKDKPEKALAFALTLLDMSRNNNWGTGHAGHFVSVGKCLATMKQYGKAQLYFDSAFVLASKYKYQTIILDVYRNKANTYKAAGDFESSNSYLAKFIEQSKMMTEDENKKKIAEMQAVYDVEKRNSQIIILNKENNLRSRQRNVFIGFTAMVGILLTVSIFAFLNKRKANRLLTIQKQQIINKTEALNEQAAQIAKLQTQMNPHFIFNAINSVQRFVLKEDKNKALDYLNDFAKLMRMTLNNSDKDLITLKEEKAFLTYYLKFEMLRYQDQFNYTIVNDKALDDEIVELPPMLVQPYVENAIKHGLISKEEKGMLTIKFELVDIDNAERLKIVIEDNGIGRQAAADLKIGAALEHESKGMEITANRVKAINKKYLGIDDSGINIVDLCHNNKPTGTSVEILLPFIDNF